MANKKGMRQQNGTGPGAPCGATPKKLMAPTLGLEDVYFTLGTAKDAAKFEDTLSLLAGNAGTRPCSNSSVASKAMSAIETPVIVEPERTVCKYWTDSTRTAKTNNKISGTANAPTPNKPVKEDWEHDLDIDDYKSKRRVSCKQEASLKDNNAKYYYPVLSDCPKELETKL